MRRPPLIDDKLGKLLNGDGPTRPPYPSEGADRLADHWIRDLLAGTDILAFAPPGSGKTGLALSFLGRLDPGMPALYVGPRLTPFSAVRMASALEALGRTVASAFWESPVSAGRILGRPDDLRGRPLPRLGLLILDDLQEIRSPDLGPDLERLLLRLPPDLPTLYLCDALSDPEEAAAWLRAARNRPCRTETPDLPEMPRIPALFSPDGEMAPLVDRKRVAGKAKKLLKGREPVPDPASGRFLRILATALRGADLVPALVLMTTPERCDRAAQACPKGESPSTAGDLLTHPRITAILDGSPILKDYRALRAALSRGAAPLHDGHHPLWNRLVEELLSLGAVDLVFAPPGPAGRMIRRFRSVLFAATGTEPDPLARNRLNEWETDRLLRLAGRPGTDPAGCIAAVHAADVDPVFLKDQLIRPPRRLSATLRCDLRTTLTLLAMGGDPAETLKRTFIGHRRPDFGRFCAEAMAADLAEEVTRPACSGHLQTVAALKDLRLKLEMRLGRLENEAKSASGRHRAGVLNEKTARESLLRRLPCEACPHHDLCHGRGTRRFREAIASFYGMAPRLRQSLTGLLYDFDHHLSCLSDFGMIAPPTGLSREGWIAFRTGLGAPQPLTECLREGVLTLGTPGGDPGEDISQALVGGFTEGAAAPFPPGTAEALADGFRELRPHWDGLEPVLGKTQEALLRFGVLAPDYDHAASATILAWRRGVDPEALAIRTGLTHGALSRLCEGAVDLWRRVMSVGGADS